MRSDNRIPVGARLYTPIQDGHVVDLATFTKGTKCFPVLNRPGRGIDQKTTHIQRRSYRKSRLKLLPPHPVSSRPILRRKLTLMKYNNLDNLEVFISFTVLLFIIILLLT